MSGNLCVTIRLRSTRPDAMRSTAISKSCRPSMSPVADREDERLLLEVELHPVGHSRVVKGAEHDDSSPNAGEVDGLNERRDIAESAYSLDGDVGAQAGRSGRGPRL